MSLSLSLNESFFIQSMALRGNGFEAKDKFGEFANGNSSSQSLEIGWSVAPFPSVVIKTRIFRATEIYIFVRASSLSLTGL